LFHNSIFQYSNPCLTEPHHDKIDPSATKMFLHRLWAIARRTDDAATRHCITDRFSRGECMSSFYDENGTMVLRLLRPLAFRRRDSDAINSLKQRFEKSLGFFDGDQFFFNDPTSPAPTLTT